MFCPFHAVLRIFSYRYHRLIPIALLLPRQEKLPCKHAFVCYSCHNKSPQTVWLRTTEIYYLTVREGRSPKSRCQQGCVLLELRGRSCFLPLPELLVADCPQCLVTCSYITLISVFMWPSALCVSVSLYPHMAFL